MRQELVLQDETCRNIGATGNIPLIDECLSVYSNHLLFLLIDGATRAGQSDAALTLLARLHPNDLFELVRRETKPHVIASGSVEVAQFIYRTPRAFYGGNLDVALQKGHLRFLQWARAETFFRRGSNDVAFRHAGSSGSKELIRWLMDVLECPVAGAAAYSAAKAGHLDLLRWVHGQAGVDLQEAVNVAAMNGRLDVLKWLVEQGCEVDENTLYKAARAPTTATLAWLLDRGFPCDEQRLVDEACRNEETGDVLKFLVEEKRIQCNPDSCKSAGMRAPWFDEAVLLRAFDTPLSQDYLERCVRWGSIDRVRYALEHGAPVGPSALTSMIDQDECAMLAETLEHSTENRQLTTKLRAVLVKGVRGAQPVSDAIVEVLAQFGHDVPEGSRVW
jgi:hypothetical protein